MDSLLKFSVIRVYPAAVKSPEAEFGFLFRYKRMAFRRDDRTDEVLLLVNGTPVEAQKKREVLAFIQEAAAAGEPDALNSCD